MSVLDPFGDQKGFQDFGTISFIIDNSQILTYFSEHLLLKCRWSGKCANHYKNIKIATYFFRILLLTGTYFIRVVCKAASHVSCPSSAGDSSVVASPHLSPAVADDAAGPAAADASSVASSALSGPVALSGVE